jgi:hypothetical protein
MDSNLNRIIIPRIPIITDLLNLQSVQGFYDKHNKTQIIKKLFLNIWYVGATCDSERQAERILYELRTKCLIDYLKSQTK